LFKTLDGLIDAGCERRVLRRFHYLLRAYPAVIVHTDQKFELHIIGGDVVEVSPPFGASSFPG
jgi:hypothetical protein